MRSSLRGMDDDALIDRGAALENELATVKATRLRLAKQLVDERPKLRKAAAKLSVNAVIAVTGIVATPVTFGISLLVTAVGIGMLAWDGVDYGKDHVRYATVLQQLRECDMVARAIAQELEWILEELEERPRPGLTDSRD